MFTNTHTVAHYTRIKHMHSDNATSLCQITIYFYLFYCRPPVLVERYKKIATLQQWLMFEGTRDNSFLKLLTLKKGIKLLSRSLPLFDKVNITQQYYNFAL